MILNPFSGNLHDPQLDLRCLPSEEDTENMGSTKVETVPETVPETTKAAPKSPLDQVYIPVGPGYN